MNYLRNAWYVAGWEHELEAGKPFPITILGERIVIYKVAGKERIVALADRCVHRLAPLSLGRCEGEKIRCMYHGMLFGPDGKVVEIPGQDLIPPQARVHAYPVVARHSFLWVWMGDPKRADEALIPPVVGLDDANCIFDHGQLDYEAEAKLVNDNLLDLSHLNYLHEKSMGPAITFQDERESWTVLDRGVRYERWNIGTPAPFGKPGELQDNFVTYDFLIPGVLIMWRGFFRPGTAAQFGHGKPDYSKAVSAVVVVNQIVTPLSRKRSRYFFSSGPDRRYGGTAMRDLLAELARNVFAEDVVMIESQQRIIDEMPDARFLVIANDKGVVLYNRLLKKLVAAEAASPTADNRALAHQAA
jgi:vanillate O-demethylase monooxygenase subunit